ncbi:cytochrome c biogenesis protein CcmG/thiol:disulfide interchange protein DsbE [Archangium gephyra]|uniref:Cytochrome c biogenesis protein CcmG/thiol:disulfide interchange protein DsbE n=1 Tax=Archangium gephyra TaxID=48 RepID=A0AAC8TEJ7_9BACT|nr:redoxin domain-containing protein [Archangium gephyra]AKJ03017.1 Cytochrome c-type biogenesis protein CcmG/DsbE, thiol:disulfide oxidoreductase [Archangium gephyra]REG25138.1 cytochrome c biogenesis protein CcmG/thiol:disulfide interchange protein DsbE [Archangium gephyra]
MNWRITVGFVVLCLGLLGVLARGFGSNPREVPFMLKGQAAPPFTLKALDSGMRVTSEQLKGRPMVINFWASWCGPCKMEHPVLEWGAREFGGQAQFLGVVFEDTEDNARQFLARMGASFPQLIDQNSGVAVAYGVAGVPETYFIDAQGIIRGKHVGPIDPESMAQWIRELSASAPSAKQ